MQQQPAQGYMGQPVGFGDTGTYPPASSPSWSYPSAPYPSVPSPSALGATGSYASAPYPALAPNPQLAQPFAPYVPVGPAQAVPPPPLNGSQRALLAALVYNPLALVGYLLYLYGPSNACMVGPFCGFATLPSPLQAFLMLLGAGLLWALVTLGLPRLLDAIPWQSGFAVGVRALTEYRLVRPLLGIYGGVLVLALLVELVTGRLNPGGLILGTVSAYVCLRCAFASAPPPVSQPA